MEKSAISGQNLSIGTGTYRHYKVVPVPTYRKGLVLVPTKVVPVPMLPTTLIFVFLYC